MSKEQPLIHSQLALREPQLLKRWEEILSMPSYRSWLLRSITRCGGCGSAQVLVLRNEHHIVVSCARQVGVQVENPRTGKKKKEMQLQSCGWRTTF